MLSGADVIVAIESVSRSRDVFVHAGRIERGQLTVGDAITAQVDRACRRTPQPGSGGWSGWSGSRWGIGDGP